VAAAFIVCLLAAAPAAAQQPATGWQPPQVSVQDPQDSEPRNGEQPQPPPPDAQPAAPPGYEPPPEQREQPGPQPGYPSPPPPWADQPLPGNPPPCGQPCPPLPICQSEPPSPRAGHHGLLLMGDLGVNSFQPGDTFRNSFGPLETRPGVRLGAMAGWYVHPQFSLNAELTLDFLRIDNSVYASGFVSPLKRGTLAFSPLLHIPAVYGLELALGPKLGLWAASVDTHGPATWSMRGYLLGINVRAYLEMGAVLVGGLLSYDSATSTKMCSDPEPGFCLEPSDR